MPRVHQFVYLHRPCANERVVCSAPEILVRLGPKVATSNLSELSKCRDRLKAWYQNLTHDLRYETTDLWNRLHGHRCNSPLQSTVDKSVLHDNYGFLQASGSPRACFYDEMFGSRTPGCKEYFKRSGPHNGNLPRPGPARSYQVSPKHGRHLPHICGFGTRSPLQVRRRPNQTGQRGKGTVLPTSSSRSERIAQFSTGCPVVSHEFGISASIRKLSLQGLELLPQTCESTFASSLDRQNPAI